jgi:hypothetical protein
MDCTV